MLLLVQNYEDESLQRLIYKNIKNLKAIIDVLIEEKEDLQHEGKGKIDNKEIIIFPEILKAGGWDTIVGFGMFES